MSPFVLSKTSPYFYTTSALRTVGAATKTFNFATYNTHFGQNARDIGLVIANHPHLNECDVIAIQEIEAHESESKTRADMIAELCDFNCVYAPARDVGEKGKNATHGLAILSKHPLEDIDIIELPRVDLGRRTRRRICLTAKVKFNGEEIRIYNVHLDTRMNAETRVAQLEPIVNDAARFTDEKIIIAGDVNTIPVEYTRNFFKYWTQTQRILLDAFMKARGYTMTEVTKKDYTLRSFGLKMMLDAVYAKNLSIIESSIEYTVKSSDHFPLLVKFAWK